MHLSPSYILDSEAVLRYKWLQHNLLSSQAVYYHSSFYLVFFCIQKRYIDSVLHFQTWQRNSHLVWCLRDRFVGQNQLGSVHGQSQWRVNLSFIPRHNLRVCTKKFTPFLICDFCDILGLKWGLMFSIQMKTISQYPEATDVGIDLNAKLF